MTDIDKAWEKYKSKRESVSTEEELGFYAGWIAGRDALKPSQRWRK